jgi:hypothetical protein
VHSRAYIAFKTEEFVAKFSREYDGHLFKDKAGVYMHIFFYAEVSVTHLLDLRERITSRGRVCTISEVAIGEEEG